MPKLPKIYKTVKTIVKGSVYIQFSCGCIFLDKEDRKRKTRSVFEINNGRKTNRTFCPNHKSNSHFQSRFKICPICESKIIVSNYTIDGLCAKCSYLAKKAKGKKIEKIDRRDCQQYGKVYKLKPQERIVAEPLCKHRSYCLSFIQLSSTLLQCSKCPHLYNDIFGN